MDTQKRNKIEEQVEKKLATDSYSNSENEMEVDDPCFIEELPEEMLIQVLENLGSGDLLNFRLTNKRGNIIARELLMSRDDLEVVFNCTLDRETRIVSFLAKNGTSTCENFIDYFEDSQETLLYTCFRFEDFKASEFSQFTWISFTCNFGENIKCLKLDLKVYANYYQFEHEVWGFEEKLRDLLLTQLPNLQEFGLQYSQGGYFAVESPSPENQFSSTSDTETTEFQLPHLKVLYLDYPSVYDESGISTFLLRAAVNLETIEPFEKEHPYSANEIFEHLHYLGKLHCVQVAEMELDPYLFAEVSEIPGPFKLKKLDLLLPADFDIGNISAASGFLLNLFESSKDTLRELNIDAWGVLSYVRLPLPKFSKLNRLFIERPLQEIKLDAPELYPSNGILAPGENLFQIFPALQFLQLQVPWNDFFGHDQSQSTISGLPYLSTLIVTGREMTGEVIPRIAEAFPKLQTLKIFNNYDDEALENFPQVGTAIWTYLKGLQSLDLTVDLNSELNSFPAVDSCITGFSQAYCQHLFNLIGVEKSVKMTQVAQSELNSERKNPSILDLKDLRHLNIRFVEVPRDDSESYYSEDEDTNCTTVELEELKTDQEQELGQEILEQEQEQEVSEAEETSELEENEEAFEQEMVKRNPLTFITKEYALKLMENLTFEIEMDDER